VEQVHQRLSESIAVGSLAPGQLLVVDQLASALGVSKTPVREAFRMLLRDGLIRETETGVRVAPLDSAYVREVYAVRSALESLAAEVIAPGLTDADLDELQLAARSAKPPDQEFHDVLRSKCPWPYLQSLIETIQVHRERVRMLEVQESAESHDAGYREHMLILEALVRRDGKQAHALMQAHLDRLRDEVSQFADQADDPVEQPARRRSGRSSRQ
jgi:DNA-binding GntR family transcriptional regulator